MVNSVTIAVIFAGVWLLVVALYCIFKLFGGRIVDGLSCDCFTGPCCDCWGAGGTIDRYDREYPHWLQQGGGYHPGGYYPQQPQPQLPPIVIVNKEEVESGGVEADSSGGSRRGAEDDEGATSLLLSSSSLRHSRRDNQYRQNVVVV